MHPWSLAMNAIAHSTDDVSHRQAFEYWHDLVCAAFVNLDCYATEREGFSGSICSWPISTLHLSTMASDRMKLVRSHRQIAKAREDCFLIALEARTTSALVQDGREGLLEAGDFAIVDSTRPYTVLFQESFEHRVLRIPRREMLQRIGNLDALTGLAINGRSGVGKLASTLCRMLPAELETLDPGLHEQVAGTLLDLFAAALGSHLTAGAVSESATRNAWFVRIRNYIEAHLGDPELSRPMIATALGVSARYVSDIFGANELSVSHYIWERRLQKCHAALADPFQRGRSISSIAFGWGFNDMSHFSRLFKGRYGVSPRDHRAHRRSSG
jgi:AraC-like DNA-binding protein